jgi:hypothetical protein
MFSYASEICIEKAQSFQRFDFDADILIFATGVGCPRWQHQADGGRSTARDNRFQ